jgi:hypothetical protein
MQERRTIRPEEKALVLFLLEKLNLKQEDFPINESVFEYEGGKMGSISFGSGSADDYEGDLIQVQYFDTDTTPVVITLTVDKNKQLLDLDFWKTDFSKLLKYPETGEIVFA